MTHFNLIFVSCGEYRHLISVFNYNIYGDKTDFHGDTKLIPKVFVLYFLGPPSPRSGRSAVASGLSRWGTRGGDLPRRLSAVG